eukprot:gene2709-3385_t
MTLSSTVDQPSAGALEVSFRGVGRTSASAIAGDPPRVVLRNIDLEIRAGEIVSLVGPSGCGKSTLLRQISGLDSPSSGQVLIAGSAPDGIDQRCAVGFQEPRLLPWRSIERNIALGLPRRLDASTGSARVAESLSLVQLDAARH